MNLVAFFLKFKKNCELFKIKNIYIEKATSSNRKITANCDNGIQPTHLRKRHPIWKLLMFRQRQKAKGLQLTFENQLFGCIHYCPGLNVSLLLNTCSFQFKFRFIFSLILRGCAKCAF